MSDKPPFHEPSSDEYDQIAKGFDVAAQRMISATGVWVSRVKWAILAFVALVILAYVGEDLWLRWNIRNGQHPFDSMTVVRFYAIHKKSGKIEYDSDDPVAESCVKAAFPHFDLKPCWYLSKNRHPVVDR